MNHLLLARLKKRLSDENKSPANILVYLNNIYRADLEDLLKTSKLVLTKKSISIVEDIIERSDPIREQKIEKRKKSKKRRNRIREREKYYPIEINETPKLTEDYSHGSVWAVSGGGCSPR
jgi:hypothetical protein